TDIDNAGDIALDGGPYGYPPQIQEPDGSAVDVPASHVFALNDAGQATGASLSVGRDLRHAYLFDLASRTFTDLGALDGSAEGRGLTEAGDVAAASGGGAFVALAGRPLRRLSALLDIASSGWTPERAEGINASGTIVGSGTIRGRRHAFVAQLVADL